ncbi:unnamed protein product [Effrenium voratum]|uniref:Uncharacterized protein n=1 Tax=Effrenium voratum TaxID=2562239 RepID=A0AA36IJX0_9DINO|nr:unnamed protein product [Effrenium voratum]
MSFQLPHVYTAAIGILTAAGKAGDAFGPALVSEWPLWLLALNANDLHLTLTSPGTHWLPWYVIGTLRRLAEDPVFFLIGWHYSDQGLAWLRRKMGPKAAAHLAKAAERFGRFGAVAVVVEPGAVVCLLAGATRMPVARFCTLNLGGTIARLLAIRALAASLPGPLETLLDLVRRFSLPLALMAALVTGVSCLGFLRSDGGEVIAAAGNDIPFFLPVRHGSRCDFA